MSLGVEELAPRRGVMPPPPPPRRLFARRKPSRRRGRLLDAESKHTASVSPALTPCRARKDNSADTPQQSWTPVMEKGAAPLQYERKDQGPFWGGAWTQCSSRGTPSYHTALVSPALTCLPWSDSNAGTSPLIYDLSRSALAPEDRNWTPFAGRGRYAASSAPSPGPGPGRCRSRPRRAAHNSPTGPARGRSGAAGYGRVDPISSTSGRRYSTRRRAASRAPMPTY